MRFLRFLFIFSHWFLTKQRLLQKVSTSSHNHRHFFFFFLSSSEGTITSGGGKTEETEKEDRDEKNPTLSTTLTLHYYVSSCFKGEHHVDGGTSNHTTV